MTLATFEKCQLLRGLETLFGIKKNEEHILIFNVPFKMHIFV